MTQTTKELLADIRKETELNWLIQCNKAMSFLNDNMKIWNVIDNKHSDCITVEGLFNKDRKIKTYVLNGNGQLLLNGSKEVAAIDYNVNYNHIGKYVFNDYLKEV